MTLIRSVQIIDGTGKPPYKADVLLSGDRISAIGSFPNKKADVVVSGLGYYLMPGFIDVNTDSDHYLSLFTNPAQEDFLKQGVTTAIGGQCGSSLAPLLYGSLESIQKWTDTNQVSVDWHTMAEFFKTLGRFRSGINFGTLIGYSTIRRAIIGEDFRDLTDGEIKVAEHAVDRAMTEGALGLSTGLGYVHSQKIPHAEIKTMVKVATRYGGIYATHLRNEKEKLLDSVGETIKIAQETGAKTLISHFRPLLNYEKHYQAALNLIEKQPAALDLHFDNYPFDVSVVPIYILLPLWAQSGGLIAMLANLEKSHTQERLVEDFLRVKGQDIIVAQAPGASYLVGKSLANFADSHELEVSQALIQLMKVTRLRAIVFYKNINKDLAIQSLMSQRGLVASNSAGLPDKIGVLKHERFYNTFPKFLEIAKESGAMTLEAAVRKVTAIPAQKFSLKDRGIIKEGYIADLVMLNDSGVENVFVGGQWAFKEGESNNVFAGKILKRS